MQLRIAWFGAGRGRIWIRRDARPSPAASRHFLDGTAFAEMGWGGNSAIGIAQGQQSIA